MVKFLGNPAADKCTGPRQLERWLKPKLSHMEVCIWLCKSGTSEVRDGQIALMEKVESGDRFFASECLRQMYR